jgi:hypothetical protein
MRAKGAWVLRRAVTVAAVLAAVGAVTGAAPAAARYRVVRTFGGKGTGDGKFLSAAGIALDGHGHVFVADRKRALVAEFKTSNGKFIRKFNSSNTGNLVMKAPLGVTVNRQGQVLVADEGSASKDGLIWEFGNDGHWLRSWNVATHGRSSDTEHPVGVAAGNGSVYASVLQADAFEDSFARIERWGFGAVEINEWGGQPNGSGPPGTPFLPKGLAVSPTGDVYVADAGEIDEYTPAGGFVRRFGRSGSGELTHPFGVAVDRHRTVYVGDPIDKRVVKFDPEGRFIAAQHIKGAPLSNGESQMWVAVDRSENLWVTSNGTNLVKKLAPIHPQTTIVSGPKGKSQKSLVSFKFKTSAPGPGSRFVCDLRGPHTGDRTKTRCNLGNGAFYLLRTGHYTLRVTAVDGEGFRDRTPAVRKFSIVDGTPPVVTAPVQRLVVGEPLGPGVPVRLRWKATDNATEASQLNNTLQRAAGDGTTFGAFADNAGGLGLRHVDVGLAPSISTYYEFRVKSEDAAGNVGVSATGPAFRPIPVDDGNALIAYAGSPWPSAANSHDYGGTARFAGTPGATASFSAKMRNVGVVMPRAPGLGKAKLCVDTSCATVNLGNVAAEADARIVFVRNGLDPQVTHAVKVTVVSGQVGLDALVVLG